MVWVLLQQNLITNLGRKSIDIKINSKNSKIKWLIWIHVLSFMGGINISLDNISKPYNTGLLRKPITYTTGWSWIMDDTKPRIKKMTGKQWMSKFYWQNKTQLIHKMKVESRDAYKESVRLFLLGVWQKVLQRLSAFDRNDIRRDKMYRYILLSRLVLPSNCSSNRRVLDGLGWSCLFLQSW